MDLENSGNITLLFASRGKGKHLSAYSYSRHVLRYVSSQLSNGKARRSGLFSVASALVQGYGGEGSMDRENRLPVLSTRFLWPGMEDRDYTR